MLTYSKNSYRLRQILLPHRDYIRICFYQGLTVSQCAIALWSKRLSNRPVDYSSIQSGVAQKTIRDLFWTDAHDHPDILLCNVLELAPDTLPDWPTLIKFIYENHPYLLTWVPDWYRQRIRQSLGLSVSDI